MLQNLKQDIARFGGRGVGRWAFAFTSIGFHVVAMHRLCSVLRRNPLGKVVCLIADRYSQLISGCYISDRARIEGGLSLPHPTGIVIGQDVIIGPNATIFQNVTIGSADRGANAYPTIGSDVTIFANAVIVGNIVIGDGVRIGAGAVVLKDIPDGCVAVGNPARVLRRSAESKPCT